MGMPLAADKIRRTSAGKTGNRKLLRTCLWGLHVTVCVWAVLSILCNGFKWWVDWRMLGGMGAAAMKIFWVGTVLVVPWCAGPRLTGIGSPRWIHAGWSAEWARRLLWPTYAVMVCLAANSAWYYRLLMEDRVDSRWPIPVTLPALVVLAAW